MENLWLPVSDTPTAWPPTAYVPSMASKSAVNQNLHSPTQSLSQKMSELSSQFIHLPTETGNSTAKLQGKRPQVYTIVWQHQSASLRMIVSGKSYLIHCHQVVAAVSIRMAAFHTLHSFLKQWRSRT